MSGVLTRMLDGFSARGVIFSDELWRSIVNARSMTGVTVTPVTAMQQSAVFACVRLLSESIASLPLHIYRTRRNGSKDLADNHPLYHVLGEIGNSEMSAFTLRELMASHVLLWGNAYANIQYDSAGNVAALWPLLPNSTFPTRGPNQELIYTTQLPEHFGYRAATLAADEVLHLRGLGGNGIVGWSPIRLMREAVGLALAAERFGAAFFGNGAQPGVILQHPAKLSPDAYKRLKESWEGRHQGLDNAQRVAILEEGMSVEKVGIPPDDAQFLQTRQFQVIEIARIFNVPPHKIADLSHATFSNIEQQSLDFVTNSLRPWLVRFEAEYKRQLMTPQEQRQLDVEHMVDGLLRGDIQTRYNAYHLARQDGWLSANDIRARENLNPVEGGDVYLVPLNMVPATSVTDETPNEPEPPEPPEPAAPPAETPGKRAAFAPVFADVVARMIARESRDVADYRRKHGDANDAAFDAWLDKYVEEHRTYVMSALQPILEGYGQLIDANLTGTVRHIADYYLQMLCVELTGEERADLSAKVADLASKLREDVDLWAEMRSK